MHDGCNARVWVQIRVIDKDKSVKLQKRTDNGTTKLLTHVAEQPVCIPTDSHVCNKVLAEKPVVFELMHDAMLFEKHNEMKFYTWGNMECCLPKGALCATLLGHYPDLTAGCTLIFKEIRNPRTGLMEDADITHRHAVRLTEVVAKDENDKPLTDPLTGKEITKIAWDPEDALPFPLCISTMKESESGRKDINNDLAEWDKENFEPAEWISEFKRILKPTGNIFAFCSYNLIGKWHAAFDPEFDTFQFMVWHKTNPVPKFRKAGFLNSCELIICVWNKGHTWNFGKQNEMHNLIESPICMGIERLKNPLHPTQKPVKVLKHVINIASKHNDLVFDPFMGVGSTGVAALELGRRFLGVEISKDYFKAAEKRLKSIQPDFISDARHDISSQAHNEHPRHDSFQFFADAKS